MMEFYYDDENKEVFITKKNGLVMNEMTKLKANTVDASLEKHVPVVSRENNTFTIRVGEVEHPMTEEHYITFICLELLDGYLIKYLKPGMKAEVQFIISSLDKPVAVYEYCNLHGLWKKDI